MLNFRPKYISLSAIEEVTSDKIIKHSTWIFDYRWRVRGYTAYSSNDVDMTWEKIQNIYSQQ